MPRSIIIGSGPAAAGAALALLDNPDQKVTILDIGATLEPELEATRQRLSNTAEGSWLRRDVARVGAVAQTDSTRGLPQKRTYGSDFPFRDRGQLLGVAANGEANHDVISGAYGGFSNVWGAQIMPFASATFDRWPTSAAGMEPHYRAALAEMHLAAEDDDLSTLFPLIEPHSALPPLAPRTRKVLHRYEQRRAAVQSHGITVGRARLALRGSDCTLCGMCMTGCPYGLIYSASQTFDRIRRDDRVIYRGGVMAIRLEQRDDSAVVHLRDVTTGAREMLECDRVFVACGGIGTTRLVLGSLDRVISHIELQESIQFVMPAVSLRAAPDPRTERAFTLNQFNLIHDGGDGRDICQIHFYPYNEVFLESLPAPLRHRVAQPVTAAALRRLSVGLGYVPSWDSPPIRLEVRPARGDELPNLIVQDTSPATRRPEMLKRAVRALVKVGPALDLWPLLPMISVSAPGKSYHFGSSFPYSEQPSDLTTDRLGRFATWDNIHLVDASVFPDVPATTFTLTVMANAHRIASELQSGAA